jgi:hypothetical protein
MISTYEKIAVIRYFAGLDIQTYPSDEKLFEGVLRDYFNYLVKKSSPETAYTIISDKAKKQIEELRQEWDEETKECDEQQS